MEEINKHVLADVPPSPGNITGVYRSVDKKYRAQVYNYGIRILLEFLVPEPAAFYLTTHGKAPPHVNATPPVPFLKDASFQIAPGAVGSGRVGIPYATAAGGHHRNKLHPLCGTLGATNVIPPPPLVALSVLRWHQRKAWAREKRCPSHPRTLVPTGYILKILQLAASIVWVNFPQFNVQVRGDIWEIQNSNDGGGAKIVRKQIGDVVGNNAHVAGVVPVSVTCFDTPRSRSISGVCLRTPEALAVWQLSTFNQIKPRTKGCRAPTTRR